MKTFKYSFIARIIYRYGNIPINLILLFYLLASILGLSADWKFLFPILINVILIYLLNRFYFKIYKTFPFRIDINNEKMICSDYVINDRSVEILIADINSIKGGIFSGRNYSPLYLKTGSDLVGISPHMKNFNKLLTILLTNIDKELYEQLLESIKKLAFDRGKSKKKSSLK